MRTRPLRILRNAAVGMTALLLLLAAATLIVVRTDWFRSYVRQQIVTSAEEATGGKAGIGKFDLDVAHLQATVLDFVIHGTEPPAAAPLLQIAAIHLHIRLFTGVHHIFDITYLGIEKPRVNVMIFADGRTNIPAPKHRPAADNSALETLVDLAVGHFELTNGLAIIDSHRQPLNIQANNLRARLYYNVLSQGYRGTLDLEPLYVLSGRNTPVTLKVTVPISIQKDRVDVHNAAISTPVSAILVNASVASMKNPKIAAHINGHIAAIDIENAANLPLDAKARGVPSRIDLDANATVAGAAIDVTGLRVTLGLSNIEASGRLRGPAGNRPFQFRTQLALGELGRLAKATARPDGTLLLNGAAELDGNNNYRVTGNVQAKNVSFRTGTQRISNVNLVSALDVDPNRIGLNGLRLDALGGNLAGNASLQNFARYNLQGNLDGFGIENAARALGQKLPYDGIISGSVSLQGDIRAPGTKSVLANVHLGIAPGHHGIPISGRLDAGYDGAGDNIIVRNSYIAFPASRLTIGGSVGKRLDIALTSHNLNDLLAAASISGPPPVVLNGGRAIFSGAVTGGLGAPRIAGHLDVNRFSVQGRQFDALAADLAASGADLAVQNGSIARGGMRADFAAGVGLRNWSVSPSAPFMANASITNGDLADVMALAGQPAAGYSGALTGTARIGGTTANPQGSANLRIANGTLANERFDEFQARANLADRLVTIPIAWLRSGAGRVDLTAEFRHPRDSFTSGSVHALLKTNELNLAQLQVLQGLYPNSSGTVRLNADVNGAITSDTFLVTSVNADASARSLYFGKQSYGDLNATAHTSGQTVSYNLTQDSATSKVRLQGNTQLVHDYPTTADANLSGLPIERILAFAKRTDIPVHGTLSGTAHVTGTMASPQGNVDLALTHAVICEEPIDSIHARVAYAAQSVDLTGLEIAAGPSRINLAARYDHPAGNLQQGNAHFNITSSHIDLARIHNIRLARPGLGGTLDISADGAATVRESSPRLLFSGLNANAAATGLTAQGQSVGDVKLIANTTSDHRLDVALDSNLAGAAIHGSATAELAGDYPVNAKLGFSHVTWTRVQTLLGTNTAAPSGFDVSTDGEVTVNGPVMKTDQLNGAAQLTRLNLTIVPHSGAAKPVTIANQGPVSATLDRGVVHIQSAHLTGPQTDIQTTGAVSIVEQTLNLNVNANAGLDLLANFDQDIYSSGKVVLAATVHGTIPQPLINGQLTLQNASLNHAQVPLGISNANGAIAFNGNTARIQNLTAESGGGKLNLSGFVSYAEVLRFALRASASNVRVRVQEGVSVTGDADIRLAGTTGSSTLSGTATIGQVAYAPQSDIGSILSRAAPPVQAPGAPSSLLENMKLDIRVRTAQGAALQASLAENLQATADLRVRGTAAQPGMLGRITIDEGRLVFFGSEYTVDSGNISFFNPIRIEPILDINLGTTAKGVTVTLRVTGPIDDMKLSYTSDPPLQFQEIVSLLAAGTTPTSDPNILANQPAQPAQGFQQMGESAIVSQALADPVASRLQRVFGVTQFKVDPSFTTGSDVPTARLTLQQRISSNLTFTYVSALDDPNSTIIRIEWALNPRFSAVATRDDNGIFSINFFYKREFR